MRVTSETATAVQRKSAERGEERLLVQRRSGLDGASSESGMRTRGGSQRGRAGIGVSEAVCKPSSVPRLRVAGWPSI